MEEERPTLINLEFDNKFGDEFFKKINGYDDILFEENIYISNYGEVYNKTQDRLYDYENSSINLKIKNGGVKGFSRWNLTINCFGISNSDYEAKRRSKKISYGCNVLDKKRKEIKSKFKTNNNFNEISSSIIDDSILYNKEPLDIEIKNLELELNKYKFFYEEVLNQKLNLEKKIKSIEEKIRTKIDNENKYKNTIIYMIRPKHNNFYMYIGHTTNKDRRLKEHIRATETDNKKIYKTIRETGGWEHWEMIVISNYVCSCKEDALKIEQEWCEKLRPNLNSISPFA
jgi:predicted GIY-YIG superfamily endonuclease